LCLISYFGLFILLLKYEDEIRWIPINICYLDILLKDINYTLTREIDNNKYYYLLILMDTTLKFLVEYQFTFLYIFFIIKMQLKSLFIIAKNI